VLTLTGAWSLIASAAEGGPRYERVVLASLSFVLAAAGTLPGDFRPTARRLVFGLMTLFFVLAGVLASGSMDEAMTLVAAGVVAALLALLFAASVVRPRHSTPGT